MQTQVEELGLPEEIILDDDQDLILESTEKHIRNSVQTFHEPPLITQRIDMYHVAS
jgi:hypothetical protein